VAGVMLISAFSEHDFSCRRSDFGANNRHWMP
jgi:hypothetical protein